MTVKSNIIKKMEDKMFLSHSKGHLTNLYPYEHRRGRGFEKKNANSSKSQP